MFFFLSKTIGALLQPHLIALLLLGFAALLRLFRQGPRLRRTLVFLAVIELWVLSTGAVSNLLLFPLETHYRRPELLPRSPAAIIMLTGLTDHERLGTKYDLTEGADRFVEAVRLAHLYPKALLVISGGSSAIVSDNYREAEILGQLARDLGLPAARMRIDAKSRNTYENAVESKQVLKNMQGPFLLVTSAHHMPRSVACFAKVGLHVVPWPVDFYRTGSGFGGAWLPSPRSLFKSSVALHEYFGWFSYWLTGYV